MTKLTPHALAFIQQKQVERFIFRLQNPPVLILTARPGRKIQIPKGLRQDADLRARSALIYYCKHCGWPTAIVEEETMILSAGNSPPQVCLCCKDMSETTLQRAKKAASQAISALTA
jgi:hypothetical protein